MPTLGAWSFRHAQGKPYVYPDNELSYTENFLAMLFKMSEQKFIADERLSNALEVLFILHADHEQNCSTNAVRSVGSSQVDPYSAVSAGIAALYGPLHGGANEAVLRMLRNIGSVDKVPEFIECVKTGKERLMGFGHRVYKNYDPRAKIIKQACDDVFEVTGVNPLLKIAVELEKIALEDEYFVSRKLYPNVDFYSGLIYEALKFPPEMFTVLFAIPRTSGWLAQWLELVDDSDQKIARPRQVYTGRARSTTCQQTSAGASHQRSPRGSSRSPRSAVGSGQGYRDNPGVAGAMTALAGRGSSSAGDPAFGPTPARPASYTEPSAPKTRNRSKLRANHRSWVTATTVPAKAANPSSSASAESTSRLSVGSSSSSSVAPDSSSSST
jgi:hypothetical protein